MRTIRIAIAAMCILIAGGSASAQCRGRGNRECDNRPRPTCAPDPYQRPAQCPVSAFDPFANMQVTAAQKQKIDEAAAKRDSRNDKARRKMETERNKATADFDKQMRKILSPEQYEQFKANNKRGTIRYHRGRRPSAAAEATEKIKLGPVQNLPPVCYESTDSVCGNGCRPCAPACSNPCNATECPEEGYVAKPTPGPKPVLMTREKK